MTVVEGSLRGPIFCTTCRAPSGAASPRSGCSCNDRQLCARRRCEFGEIVAHAAGCASHQQATACDRTHGSQQPQGCQAGQGERRGGHDIDRSRKLGRSEGERTRRLHPGRVVWVGDDPRPLTRTGAIARRTHHDAGDVLSGPPTNSGRLLRRRMSRLDHGTGLNCPRPRPPRGLARPRPPKPQLVLNRRSVQTLSLSSPVFERGEEPRDRRSALWYPKERRHRKVV